MAIAGIFLFGCTTSNTDEWISLFDGESLEGWTANESPDSWLIEDGAIVTAGVRSHLFYTGDVLEHNFKNFEFSVDVKTKPEANSGIYIHTKFQEEGWPYDGSFRQEQAYARFIGAGNSGYAMTAWCWDWVVTIPIPGGKWMYNENWSPWDARKIPRAYVRGLKAVSKLIAFADYSVDNGYGGLNWGEGGFRHDKGGKFEDWWKNMVFWDGHVGEYEIDTGKSEYWNDTDE